MRIILSVFLTICWSLGSSAQPLDPITPFPGIIAGPNPLYPTVDFGNDEGPWPADGECDDPRFGGVTTGMELTAIGLLRDATDCRTAYESGLIVLNPVDLVAVDNGNLTTCSSTLGSMHMPMASCLLEYWQAPETSVATAWTRDCTVDQIGSIASDWERIMTCRGSQTYPGIGYDISPAPAGAYVRDYAWLPPNPSLPNSETIGPGQGWFYPTSPSVWLPSDSSFDFSEDGPTFPLDTATMERFGIATPARGVEVFFATDRQAKQSDPFVTFAGLRADTTTLGKMVVSVPLNHTRGETERPGMLLWTVQLAENPSEHFVITSLEAQSSDDFLGSLAARQRLGTSYKDHALVYVHGFANTFEDAAYRMAQMTYDMQFDGVPIIYSWPSMGPLSDYVSDLATSEVSSLHLANFMRFLLNSTDLEQIHLICHSMGCNAAIRALEEMEERQAEDIYALDDNGAPAALGEILFAAPDVDTEVFERFARKLAAMDLPMTLYASGSDKALWAAGNLLSRYPRAGFIPEGTEPALVEGLETIDITALGLDWLEPEHSDFADEAVIMNDIGLLLSAGMRPPPRRTTGYKTMRDATGRTYWLY